MATKAYLRYDPGPVHGIVTSPDAPIATEPSAGYVLCPACEAVNVFHARSGQVVVKLQAPPTAAAGASLAPATATATAVSPSGTQVAVGYSDGGIVVFSLPDGEPGAVLRGHARAVTALAWSSDGAAIASGSQDTHVIVWDTAGETAQFKLRGHRDEITALCWLPGLDEVAQPELDGPAHASLQASGALLASGSKDGFVRVWDTGSQACVQVVVGHRGAVWRMAVTASPRARLATLSVDADVRIFEVDPQAAKRAAAAGATQAEGAPEAEAQDSLTIANTASLRPLWLRPMGSVQRAGTERGAGLVWARDGRWLYVASAGREVQVFATRDDDHVAKKVARRKRRAREKGRAKAKSAEGPGDAPDAPAMTLDDIAHTEGGGELSTAGTVATDELELWGAGRSGGKVRSIAVLAGVGHGALPPKLAVATSANTVELVSGEAAPASEEPGTPGSLQSAPSIGFAGHGGDVRATAISADGTLAVTGGAFGLKLWHLPSEAALRHMECGAVVSVCWAPGDKHVLAGTVDGRLCLLDIATGDVVQEHMAHEGTVWSLATTSDQRGVASGSADRSVKCWEWEVVEARPPRPGLVHTRTLRLNQEVLCVKYSKHKDAGSRLLAVALLDCTIKLFHDDSLKFFLSLYGHKLPVLAMDICADSSLLVSASSDKNVRIWGLDFGDCHKSIFAHDDSVTAVAFVSHTHYFFTAAKDARIRYWDADRFIPIMTLRGHVGSVWALACSTDGRTLLSTGADRSMRTWLRGEGMVFPEEEADKEEEAALLESARPAALPGVPDEFLDDAPAGGDAEQDPHKDAVAPESGAVATTSAASGTGTERLVEALQIARDTHAAWLEWQQDSAAALADLSAEDRAARAAAVITGKPVPELMPPPVPSPLLLNKTPAQFVLWTVRQMPAGDLTAALLPLNTSDAVDLLRYCLVALRAGFAVETAVRTSTILVKLHGRYLTAGRAAQDVLLGLRSAARAAAASSKDTVGVVHAGLAVLQRQLQAAGQVWTAGEKRGRGYDAEAAAGTAVRTKHRNAVIF